MASVPPAHDPRTAPDDDAAFTEDATPEPAGEPDRGVSSPDPAEGRDDEPPETDGSPQG